MSFILMFFHSAIAAIGGFLGFQIGKKASCVGSNIITGVIVALVTALLIRFDVPNKTIAFAKPKLKAGGLKLKRKIKDLKNR